MVRAYKSDKKGNLVFRKTARNFNPDIAAASKFTIAEVEEIVENGDLKSDEIHIPGIFVDRVIKCPSFSKRIEKLVTKSDKGLEISGTQSAH